MHFFEFSVNLNIDLLSEYAAIADKHVKVSKKYENQTEEFRNKMDPLGIQLSEYDLLER